MVPGRVGNNMTKARINWPAVAVITLCASVWAAAAGSSLKLDDIYQHRGAHGFRQALLMRVEHRLGLHPYQSEGRDG